MWEGSDKGMRKEQQGNGNNKGATRELEGKTREWEGSKKGAIRE